LKKLQQKGIIQAIAEGNRKYAYFSETKHASLLRGLLLSYDFMGWENILRGKSIEILFPPSITATYQAFQAPCQRRSFDKD